MSIYEHEKLLQCLSLQGNLITYCLSTHYLSFAMQTEQNIDIARSSIAAVASEGERDKRETSVTSESS